MKRSPELKPNFWDGIVALAVIALAAAAALTVWQSRPESGALTAVVSANGQEIDRFVPADCVHTGRITRSGQSIVCLPARIVIQLTGGQPDGDAVDIVIG